MELSTVPIPALLAGSIPQGPCNHRKNCQSSHFWSSDMDHNERDSQRDQCQHRQFRIIHKQIVNFFDPLHDAATFPPDWRLFIEDTIKPLTAKYPAISSKMLKS